MEYTVEVYDKIQQYLNRLIEEDEKKPKEQRRVLERTEAAKTKKGYDTSGIKYQFLVNALNEVVGPSGWGYDFIILSEGLNQNGWHEIVVRVDLNILGTKRSHVGGHVGKMKGDAIKGAITGGLKKALGMAGVGKEVYEGTLDDDNEPVDDVKSIIHKCDSKMGCDSTDTKQVTGTKLWACPAHYPQT